MAKSDDFDFNFDDDMASFDFDSGGPSKPSKSSFFKDMAKGIIIGSADKLGQYAPILQDTRNSVSSVAEEIRDDAYAIKTQMSKITAYVPGIMDDVKKTIKSVKESKSILGAIKAVEAGYSEAKKNLAYKIDPEAASSFDFDSDMDFGSSESSGSVTPGASTSKPNNKPSDKYDDSDLYGGGGVGDAGDGRFPPGSGGGGSPVVVNVPPVKPGDEVSHAIQTEIGSRILAQQGKIFKESVIISTRHHVQQMSTIRNIADNLAIQNRFNADLLGPAIKVISDHQAKHSAQLTDMIALLRDSSGSATRGSSPIQGMYGGNLNRGRKKNMLDFTTAYGGIDLSNVYKHSKEKLKDQISMMGLDMIADMKDMIPMMLMGGEGLNIGEAIGRGIGKLAMSPFKKQAMAAGDKLSGMVPGAMIDIYEKMKKSDNGILNSIAEFLDIDTGTKSTVSLKTDNRRVGFDMRTRQAITEVIPGHLAEIAASLSGGQKRVFDYESGQFTTEQNVRDQLTAKINKAGMGYMSSPRGDLLTAAGTRGTKESTRKSFDTIIKNIVTSGTNFTGRKIDDYQMSLFTKGVPTEDFMVFLDAYDRMPEKARDEFNTNVIRARSARTDEIGRLEVSILENAKGSILGSSINENKIRDLTRQRHDLSTISGEPGSLDLRGKKRYMQFVKENAEIDREIQKIRSIDAANVGASLAPGKVQGGTYGHSPLARIYDLLLEGVIVYPREGLKPVTRLPPHLLRAKTAKSVSIRESRDTERKVEKSKEEYENLVERLAAEEAEAKKYEMEERRKSVFEKLSDVFGGRNGATSDTLKKIPVVGKQLATAHDAITNSAIGRGWRKYVNTGRGLLEKAESGLDKLKGGYEVDDPDAPGGKRWVNTGTIDTDTAGSSITSAISTMAGKATGVKDKLVTKEGRDEIKTGIVNAIDSTIDKIKTAKIASYTVEQLSGMVQTDEGRAELKKYVSDLKDSKLDEIKNSDAVKRLESFVADMSDETTRNEFITSRKIDIINTVNTVKNLVLDKVPDSVKTGIADTGKKIGSFVSDMSDKTTRNEFIESRKHDIENTVNAVKDKIPDNVKTGIADTVHTISETAGNVKTAISDRIPDDVKLKAFEFGDSVKKGAKSFFSSVSRMFESMLHGNISEKDRKALNKSDPKFMADKNVKEALGPEAVQMSKLKQEGKLGIVDTVKLWMQGTAEKFNMAIFGKKEDGTIVKEGLLSKVQKSMKGVMDGVMKFMMGNKETGEIGFLKQALGPAFRILENARHKIVSKMLLPLQSTGEALGKRLKWWARDTGISIKRGFDRFKKKAAMKTAKRNARITKKNIKIAEINAKREKQGKKPLQLKKYTDRGGFFNSVVGGALNIASSPASIAKWASGRNMRKLLSQGKVSQDDYDKWNKDYDERQDSELKRHNQTLDNIEKWGTEGIDWSQLKDKGALETKFKDFKAEQARLKKELDDNQYDYKADKKQAKANAKKNAAKVKAGEALRRDLEKGYITQEEYDKQKGEFDISEEEAMSALTKDQQVYRKQDDMAAKLKAEMAKQKENEARIKAEREKQNAENVQNIADNVASIVSKGIPVTDEEKRAAAETVKQSSMRTDIKDSMDKSGSKPKEHSHGLEGNGIDEETGQREGSRLDQMADKRKDAVANAIEDMHATLKEKDFEVNMDDKKSRKKDGENSGSGFFSFLKTGFAGVLATLSAGIPTALAAGVTALTTRRYAKTAQTFKEEGAVGGFADLTGADSHGDSAFNRYTGEKKGMLEAAGDRFKANRFVFGNLLGNRGPLSLKNTAKLVKAGWKNAGKMLKKPGVGKKVAKKAAEKAVTITERLTKMIGVILNNPTVKKKLGKETVKRLSVELPKQIGTKLAKSAAFQGAKKAGSAVLSFLTGGTWLAVTIAADFGTGMANARRYFAIPPGMKVTLGMRIASGLANTLNNQLLLGLVDMPWLVETIYRLVANDEQEAQLDQVQQARRERAAALGIDADRLNEWENKTIGQQFTDNFRSQSAKDERDAKLLGFATVEEYAEFKKSYNAQAGKTEEENKQPSYSAYGTAGKPDTYSMYGTGLIRTAVPPPQPKPTAPPKPTTTPPPTISQRQRRGGGGEYGGGTTDEEIPPNMSNAQKKNLEMGGPDKSGSSGGSPSKKAGINLKNVSSLANLIQSYSPIGIAMGLKNMDGQKLKTIKDGADKIFSDSPFGRAASAHKSNPRKLLDFLKKGAPDFVASIGTSIGGLITGIKQGIASMAEKIADSPVGQAVQHGVEVAKQTTANVFDAARYSTAGQKVSGVWNSITGGGIDKPQAPGGTNSIGKLDASKGLHLGSSMTGELRARPGTGGLVAGAPIKLNDAKAFSGSIKKGFTKPSDASSYVTQPFGEYTDGGQHFGIDVGDRNNANSMNRSVMGGTVVRVQDGFQPSWNADFIKKPKNAEVLDARYPARTKAFGNAVTVKMDDGSYVTYAHQEKNFVNEGDKVKQGQPVGIMGNTGNSFGKHLHLQVQKDGKSYDPVEYLNTGELSKYSYTSGPQSKELIKPYYGTPPGATPDGKAVQSGGGDERGGGEPTINHQTNVSAKSFSDDNDAVGNYLKKANSDLEETLAARDEYKAKDGDPMYEILKVLNKQYALQEKVYMETKPMRDFYTTMSTGDGNNPLSSVFGDIMKMIGSASPKQAASAPKEADTVTDSDMAYFRG
jgi:murein DD-endopeptidase MepM/ murein hydrolase activator NlpD